jgi:glutathione S-transferase
MKLYHHPLSPNARKAVMAASLLGTDLELVLVDLPTGKNQAPEYLKINPMGKVPSLEDGDLTLWESHAIMQYLADKKPGNTLYPVDLAARADVNRWLFWTSTHWSPYMAMLVNQNVLKKMMGKGDPDPAIVAIAEGEIARFGKVLDEHLATRDYVSGKTLTLADLAISAALMYTAPGKLPVAHFANIQKWFGRIQDLDAWKQTSLRN